MPRGKTVAAYSVSSERMAEALRASNGKVYTAARFLGCSHKTIYARMKREPELVDILEEARGLLIDLAENKLELAIERDEPWAIALVLKTIGKHRGWVERQEVTGAEGSTIAPATFIVNFVGVISPTEEGE